MYIVKRQAEIMAFFSPKHIVRKISQQCVENNLKIIGMYVEKYYSIIGDINLCLVLILFLAAID